MKKFLLTLTLFSGALAAGAQNIYGSFENWHSYTAGGTALEAPQGWSGSDSIINALGFFNSGSAAQKQVYKSTAAHGGSFAVQAITKNFGGSLIDTFAGGIVNGQPTISGLTSGSPTLAYTNLTPVTSRPAGLSAWIKYIPATGSLDSGAMTIQAIKSGAGAGGGDSVLAYTTLRIGATPAYTQMTATLNYGANTLTPDKVLILFGSSNLVGFGASAAAVHATPGSEIDVDDAALNMASGIAQPLFGQPAVKCFPNPSNGVINFETQSTAPLTWQAFSADGRLVANYTFTGAGAYAFGEQASGMYLYRIMASDGTAVQNGSFFLKR